MYKTYYIMITNQHREPPYSISIFQLLMVLIFTNLSKSTSDKFILHISASHIYIISYSDIMNAHKKILTSRIPPTRYSCHKYSYVYIIYIIISYKIISQVALLKYAAHKYLFRKYLSQEVSIAQICSYH